MSGAASANPGKDIHDHVLLEMYYLHSLLQEFLGRAGTAEPAEPAVPAWPAPAPDGAGPAPEGSDAGAAEIARIDRLRADIAGRLGDRLPLIRLQRTLGYGEVDHLRLLLCLAPQIDPRFEDLYRSIAQETAQHPLEPGFASLLLGHDWPRRLQDLAGFGPDHPLRSHGIVRFDESLRRIRVDERILQFSLGLRFEPGSLRAISLDRHPAPPLEALEPWVAALRPRLQHARGGMGLWLPSADPRLPDALCAISAGWGRAVLGIDAAKLAGVEDPGRALETWLRECLLRDAIALLHVAAPAEPGGPVAGAGALGGMAGMFRRSRIPLVVCTQSASLPAALEPLQLEACELPAFDARMRGDLWRALLGGEADSQAIAAAARTFEYDLDASLRIARRAAGRLAADPSADLAALLNRECGAEAQRHVVNLGQLVTSRYDFDDIVLPEGTLSQLKELCAMARLQEKVRTEWGLAAKLMPRASITALFAGPSGTGKSMSAEIIAARLGRPLLRVDLAAVVSKYIGETEKNLEKVFRQAEESCSVLFFDEADALFGKRSEVKEAHDRYSNIEISYLLQRMEQYRGMAILATNLRQHLDDAFVRRLTMTVLFPFPSAEQRARIWRRLLPPEAPVDAGVDWDDIAQRYKLSGGNIRNAMVSAAFHAAMDGGVMVTESVMHGIRREIQKMGKQLIIEGAE